MVRGHRPRLQFCSMHEIAPGSQTPAKIARCTEIASGSQTPATVLLDALNRSGVTDPGYNFARCTEIAWGHRPRLQFCSMH